MIERESQIKELYDLKHRKDKEINTHFDWENKLLEKMLPAYIFKNDTMDNFLMRLQKLMVWMYESNVVVRNMYNYTVSKYYSKHTN